MVEGRSDMYVQACKRIQATEANYEMHRLRREWGQLEAREETWR